jgi:acetoin utilization protein AcuB
VEVEKWMTRQLHCVRPLDSIQHARELMEQHRINQLPVVVEGRLVGIVTDRDLRDAFPSVFDSAYRVETHHANPKAIIVETVMTPHVLTLSPKDSMAEAARVMRRERVGAIPVVDGNRLVGLITRSDVLDAFVALCQGPTPLERAEKRNKR